MSFPNSAQVSEDLMKVFQQYGTNPDISLDQATQVAQDIRVSVTWYAPQVGISATGDELWPAVWRYFLAQRSGDTSPVTNYQTQTAATTEGNLPPQQSAADSLPEIESEIAVIVRTLHDIDPSNEITGRPWALAIGEAANTDIRNRLRGAAWAYAAGTVLDGRWPPFDKIPVPGKRSQCEQEFRSEVSEASPGPNVLISHSFTTGATKFTQLTFTEFLKGCFAALDDYVTRNPGPGNRQAVAACFDHNKGYAVSAKNATDLQLSATITGIAGEEQSSTVQAGPPGPDAMMRNLYGERWENHPFKRTPNWNKIPDKDLGVELSGYKDKELASCAKDIWSQIHAKMYYNEAATKAWIQEWKDHGLVEALIPLAGSQQTASKIVGLLATIGEDSFDD
jgi:hypothetical protein